MGKEGIRSSAFNRTTVGWKLRYRYLDPDLILHLLIAPQWDGNAALATV